MFKEVKNYKLILVFFLLSVLGLMFVNYSGSKPKLDKLIVACDTSDDKVRCWKKTLEKVIVDYDLDVAFNLMDEWYKRDKDFAVSCHDFAHLLGKEAYKLFRSRSDFRINAKTAYCSYGFYHGFMENLAAVSDNYSEAREFCNYVDSQLSKETPDVSLQCFHGMGHGWVNVHDNPAVWGNVDLIVGPALDLCRKVSSNESQLTRCATGVYNGVVLFMIDGEYGLKIDETEPLKICMSQPNEFKDACFISMNILLMALTKGDFEKASHFIEKIDDANMARHAMINLAAVESLPSLKKEGGYARQINICRKLQDRLVHSCLQGYAYGFMENGQPGEEYLRPLEFCAVDELNEKEKESCYEYIFSYLPMWYSEEKVLEICSDLGDKLSLSCINTYSKVRQSQNEIGN